MIHASYVQSLSFSLCQKNSKSQELDHAPTNNPTALTTQVEAATINAAKIGGTIRSSLDFTNK